MGVWTEFTITVYAPRSVLDDSSSLEELEDMTIQLSEELENLLRSFKGCGMTFEIKESV